MRRQTSFLLAAIILLVASFLTSANATVRTFQFNGTIASSGISGVSVGDAFVATLSYDDAQAPTSTFSGGAVYVSFNYSLTVSSMTFTKQASQFIQVNHLASPQDHFFAGGTGFPRLDFSLRSSANNIFSSTALPASLTLSDFDIQKTVTWSVTATEYFQGNITSITDLTPTPGLCPQPQGDWKNNPDWPVAELELGSQTYSQSELVNILNMPVGRGNDADASLILAKQLIAAKLNIANGVEASEEVQDAVNSADGFIGSAPIPMSVDPRTTSGKQMTGVAGFLESFNKGELTPGCSLAKSGVTEETDMTQLLPDVYVLDQNYPNPFNPTTQIRFGIPEAGNVTLKIYSGAGQLVKTLVDGNMSSGFHQLTWDATDNRGIKLSSGVYFYRITAGTFTQMHKMVLLK